jgi:predicted PurR-regulated permease PerM
VSTEPNVPSPSARASQDQPSQHQPLPALPASQPVPVQPSQDPPRLAEVPYGLRVSAAWSWRLLLIGVVIYLLGKGFVMFELLVVPLLVSLLLVALVRPIQQALARNSERPGLPNSAAALLTLLLTLGLVAALMTLIGQQVVTGFADLRDDAADGLTELQKQLANSPLHLTNAQLDSYVQQASEAVRGNSGTVVSSALTVTSTAGHLLTGFFLVLFSSYFFLAGGEGIWSWVVGLFPRQVRPRVRGAGVRAWATLTSFVRATLIVALVDGLGVGIGAAILGVPLALPLGVLVFLGAFVPIVGALVSGIVAVLVALVSGGPVEALIMLAIVIGVQQVEAHALQPFLLGRAVQVHPLGVILAIAAGVLLAGIVGALFAVPLVAVVNVVATYLSGSDDDDGPHPEEEVVGPLADATEESSDTAAAEARDAADEASTDGTSTDGTSTDETSTDGTRADGASADGASADGAGADGASTDGASTDGTRAGNGAKAGTAATGDAEITKLS